MTAQQTKHTEQEIEAASAMINAAMDRAEQQARDRGDLTDTSTAEEITAARISAVTSVPPVAFSAKLKDGADLTNPETFLSPSVEITPIVNPLFHALMLKIGATVTGARTYSFAAGERANPKALRSLLAVFPGGICYAKLHEAEGEKVGFHNWNQHRAKVFSDVFWAFKKLPAMNAIDNERCRPLKDLHPTDGPMQGAAIVINANEKTSQLHIKICTTKSPNKDGLYLTGDIDCPNLDRLRPSNKLDPVLVTPDMAITLLEAAAQSWQDPEGITRSGYTVVDPTGDMKLVRSVLADMVLAQRVQGAPGAGRLVVGSNVKVTLPEDAERKLPPVRNGHTTRSARVTARIAAGAIDAAREQGVVTTLDPAVEDVIRMAEAGVAPENGILRPYQREWVALHGVTTTGGVNALAVGLGKTASVLGGFMARAERKSKLLDQAADFAPRVREHVQRTSEDVAEAISAPVVIVEPEPVTPEPEVPAVTADRETVTLYCENGSHTWERPRQRGAKPKNCPDHR